MKRKAIPPSVRFAVLHRDGFQCVYCGSSSDDAVLEIDHEKPVALGGDNSFSNLVTACRACNSGKSAQELNYRIREQRRYAVAVLSHFWAERRFGLEYVDDREGFATVFHAVFAVEEPNEVLLAVTRSATWPAARQLLLEQATDVDFTGALEKWRSEIGSIPPSPIDERGDA